MSTPSPFEAAASWIRANLKSTGFTRHDSVPEPDLPETLEDLDINALKTLYDKYLTYYSYIAGELVLLHGVRDVSKERATVSRAESTLRVSKNSKNMTADVRKAAVECDPKYVATKLDHVKIQGLFRAQEERRKTASKIMDRIGRELYYKTGRTFHQDSGQNKGSKPWQGHQKASPPSAQPRQEPPRQEPPLQEPPLQEPRPYEVRETVDPGEALPASASQRLGARRLGRKPPKVKS